MAVFTTFKIRDLMVSVRPGWCGPTPEQRLEECGNPASIQCDAPGAPFATGAGGGCGCTDGGTLPCGGTDPGGGCGGTDPCGCSNACTGDGPTDLGGGGGGCGRCTQGCTATCQGRSCQQGRVTQFPEARLCVGTGCIASDPGVIPRMGAGDLAVLRDQLRLAMQQVDRREAVLRAAAEGAALQPQTIAEVDALEKKLSEALDELRTRRAELQKAADAEGQASDSGDK